MHERELGSPNNAPLRAFSLASLGVMAALAVIPSIERAKAMDDACPQSPDVTATVSCYTEYSQDLPKTQPLYLIVEGFFASMAIGSAVRGDLRLPD